MQYVSRLTTGDVADVLDNEESLPAIPDTVRAIAANGVKRPMWTRHDEGDGQYRYDPTSGTFTMAELPTVRYSTEQGGALGWSTIAPESSPVVNARTQTRVTRSRKGRTSFVPTVRNDHLVTTGSTEATGHDWSVERTNMDGSPKRLTDSVLDRQASAYVRSATRVDTGDGYMSESLPETLDYRGILRRADGFTADPTDDVRGDRAMWAGLTGGRLIDSDRMFEVPVNVSHGIIPDAIATGIEYGLSALVPHAVDAAEPMREILGIAGPDDATAAARSSRDGSIAWPDSKSVRTPSRLPSVISSRCPVVADVVSDGKRRVVRGEQVGDTLRIPTRTGLTVDGRAVWFIGAERVDVEPRAHGVKSTESVKHDRMLADIRSALDSLAPNQRTTVHGWTLEAPIRKSVRRTYNGKAKTAARKRWIAHRPGETTVQANTPNTLAHLIGTSQ